MGVDPEQAPVVNSSQAAISVGPGVWLLPPVAVSVPEMTIGVIDDDGGSEEVVTTGFDDDADDDDDDDRVFDAFEEELMGNKELEDGAVLEDGATLEEDGRGVVGGTDSVLVGVLDVGLTIMVVTRVATVVLKVLTTCGTKFPPDDDETHSAVSCVKSVASPPHASSPHRRSEAAVLSSPTTKGHTHPLSMLGHSVMKHR